MAHRIGRRALAVSASLAGLAACADTAAAKGRVVVIGGGFGGATAARKVKELDPAIDVTLIEPSATFITCPFSNYVIAGFKQIGDITHSYERFGSQYGVRVVRDTASAIDPAARTVRTADGQSFAWDRLIVSPGIDLRWGAIAGYTEATAETMPHAWRAGPQTLLLRRQLVDMRDGGVVILSVPANPFRCPPGPYERTAMIAHYLKQAKPRSKILVLDAKDAFSKQGLFQDGWKALYGDMIEWVPLAKDGRVTEARPAEMTLVSEFGQRHRGDVINVIPPQYAGAIARSGGLAAESGWCPVDPVTFESTLVKGVHVIGDACIAGAMPKSGFAANSQGKVAALAVVDALNGRPTAAPTYVNTCYSLLAPDYGITVADVYRVGPQGIAPVPNAGGVSPRNADAATRSAEARYAEGWYRSMSVEVWGG
jgi:sulfide dehydrogenase [flavocytochrome c] flavoprotein subunit